MNLQAQADPMLVADVADNPAEFAERIVHPTVKVVRTLRQDPLGQMFARNQIGPVEHAAGRQWQKEYEAAGPRLKSSGALEEPVDGSRPTRDGITDRQMQAHGRIVSYRQLLGAKHYAVLEAVLADKLSMWGVVCRFWPEDLTPARRRFCGTLFRDLLSQLARAMGLAS